MPGLTCFKAYDIRGRVGHDLTEDIAFRIGRAFAAHLSARRVVVGRDCRLSSPALAAALSEGLLAQGADVTDLGLCGTEEVYFAAAGLDACGGLMVTASHNPADENGLKLIGPAATPLDPARDLAAIRALAETGRFSTRAAGRLAPAPDTRARYVERILSFVDPAALPPLTLLVNPGNGAAGPTFDAIAAELSRRGAPLRFHRMNHTPNGRFPSGVPNPLLPENRPATGAAVREAGADLGVAWDGDFDRCFLFDAAGRFVPGEIVTGLLAEAVLARHPGATILHDPRTVLNVADAVAAAGGRAVQARTGHVFLKQAMRETGAVYGGEMSGHHYFRDFACCDSGMIPWLMVVGLLGRGGSPLAALLDARRARFPSSGEINFRLTDPDAALARTLAALGPEAAERDDLDGISLAFPRWRFNLRRSNTESLLRLNVETRGDPALLAEKTTLLQRLIAPEDATAD